MKNIYLQLKSIANTAYRVGSFEVCKAVNDPHPSHLSTAPMTVSPSLKASSHLKYPPPSTSIPPPSPKTRSAETDFLATVEGEISFFRSIMRARPVGLHCHFHILAIQSAIQKDTGRLLHVESIWQKLQSCYDLDALDAIVSTLDKNAVLYQYIAIDAHLTPLNCSELLGT